MRIGAVPGHKLNDTFWGEIVVPKFIACMSEMGVKWTSGDIVHFTKFGEPCGPASLSIGVRPKSLTDEDANAVAFRCIDLLKEFDITDIDVEIRETLAWPYFGE